MSGITPGQSAEMRGALHYAKLVHLLLTTGASIPEMVEETGFHEHTIHRYVKAMRHMPMEKRGMKLLRVIAYLPDSRGYRTIRVYKLEIGHDVKSPRMTDAQKSRAYRERKKRFAGSAISVFEQSGMSRNDLHHSSNAATVSTFR